MRTRVVILAVAVFVLGVACQVADQHEAGSAMPQKSDLDPRMEELKYSKFCTEAAEKFWNRHDWKNQRDLTQIASYTSHYNKKLNKCLVDVHGISPLKGNVLESDHVYDALEDTVLGGRLLVKKGRLDGDIESQVLIKEGRTIRDKQAAASFVPWFQSLMTQ
jgi:hypothetical protein